MSLPGVGAASQVAAVQAAVVELPSLAAIADPTGKQAGGADAAGVDGLSLVSPDDECAVASLPPTPLLPHPPLTPPATYLPYLPGAPSA